MSKLHCTFLFSDESEWELFVAKIISEQHLISFWFVVDSAYSFKGKIKGLSASKLLKNESRLNAVRDRIKIIEIEDNLLETLNLDFDISGKIRRQFSSRELSRRIATERKFFSVEKLTRDFATEFILNLTYPQDWLLISDVDEILETANGRDRYISSKLDQIKSKFLMVHRLRYVFDFDNLDSQIKFSPIIKISLLHNNSGHRISEFRFRRDGSILTANPLVFEYSYCFDMNSIRRKLKNFAHIGPAEDMFEASFRLNHHFIHPGDNANFRFWLEKQEVEASLHPKYIFENMSRLITNNVDPNYKLNRKTEMSEFFNIEN